MSNSERLSQILDYLKKHRSASVEEIANMLYVSVATVRRDLTELQKRGQINRSRGGAVLMEGADEISFFIRQIKNAREKEEAAFIALKHLPEFQTIFIDNSSTCLALTQRMNLAHKTVVTNGLNVAMRISRQDDITLIMPGGEVKFNTTAVLGSMATNHLNDLKFDLSIISCAAVDKDGSYEFSLESMQLKKIALQNSKTKILIFDNTKVNTSATFKTAALDFYDYIFTNATDAQLRYLDPDGTKKIINQ